MSGWSSAGWEKVYISRQVTKQVSLRPENVKDVDEGEKVSSKEDSAGANNILITLNFFDQTLRRRALQINNIITNLSVTFVDIA
jgi:hypothetical protein